VACVVECCCHLQTVLPRCPQLPRPVAWGCTCLPCLPSRPLLHTLLPPFTVQAALLPVLGHASRPLRHTAGTCAVTIVNQTGLGAWPELVAALAEGLDAAGDANRLEGALDLVYKASGKCMKAIAALQLSLCTTQVSLNASLAQLRTNRGRQMHAPPKLRNGCSSLAHACPGCCTRRCRLRRTSRCRWTPACRRRLARPSRSAWPISWYACCLLSGMPFPTSLVWQLPAAALHAAVVVRIATCLAHWSHLATPAKLPCRRAAAAHAGVDGSWPALLCSSIFFQTNPCCRCRACWR